jgi:hypothetical protein
MIERHAVGHACSGVQERVAGRHDAGQDASDGDLAVLAKLAELVDALSREERLQSAAVDPRRPVAPPALAQRWLDAGRR